MKFKVSPMSLSKIDYYVIHSSKKKIVKALFPTDKESHS